MPATAPAEPLRTILMDWDGDPWLDVATALAERGVLRPVYWTAFSAMRRRVETAFPTILFHDSADAVRGLDAEAGAPPTEPDAAVWARLEDHRTLAVRMMDRMDPDGLSFAPIEREAHFTRLVRQWTGILTRHRPDLVVFPIAPHLIYDYVCYALCGILGIPTVMFERTALPERILVVERFEEGCIPLRDTYRRLRAAGGAAPALTPTAEAWLHRWRGSYAEGMPANLQLKLERNRLRQDRGAGVHYPGPAAVALQQLKRLGRTALANRGRAPANYLKQRGRPIARSRLSLAGWGWSSLRGILRKRRLLAAYVARQRLPDLDAPFVFVALHYQPERNTSPVGGPYVDQTRMVRAIAEALPAGWSVYVKEHSWQLHPYSKGERGRGDDDYARLAAIPGVVLVPMDLPSFDLIDRSRAVATVSGSAGWEAVCRGRPSLIFGAAWYQACDGVFRIRSDADCRPALQDIAAGHRPDGEAVRWFLAATELVGHRAAIEPGLDAMPTLSNRENIAHLADALALHIARMRAASDAAEAATAGAP